MLVKCQKCGIKDTDRSEMMFEVVGEKKPIKKYYHKHCWNRHLKEKQFIEEEERKKDELNKVILEIYGVKEVPQYCWGMLQRLRNGNPIFAKQKPDARYKQGYDYLLIKDTFEYCSETIENANRRIKFDGFANAFKYALSIILDKIYVVEQRNIDNERQKALVEQHMATVNEDEHEFDSSYKKKQKSNVDITDFLD